VLPTHVGMVRISPGLYLPRLSAPHAGGDSPTCL